MKIKITLDTGNSVHTMEAKGFLIIAQTEEACELHKFNVSEAMEKYLLDDMKLDPVKRDKTKGVA